MIHAAPIPTLIDRFFPDSAPRKRRQCELRFKSRIDHTILGRDPQLTARLQIAFAARFGLAPSAIALFRMGSPYARTILNSVDSTPAIKEIVTPRRARMRLCVAGGSRCRPAWAQHRTPTSNTRSQLQILRPPAVRSLDGSIRHNAPSEPNATEAPYSRALLMDRPTMSTAIPNNTTAKPHPRPRKQVTMVTVLPVCS